MQKSTAVVGMLIAGALGFFLGTLTKGGLGVSPTDSKGAADGAGVVAGAADPGVPFFNVPVGASAVKGPANAKVTIVEFSDFQCPFCSRVLPTVDEIMKAYPTDVRLVFKHNPLPMHPDAPLAALAGVAAQNQGKFWEMHDKMFANQKAIKREDLIKYAGEIGCDVAKFTADLDDPATKARVDADVKLGASIGTRGTPNFYINGENLAGAQPVEKFKAAVEAAKARADKLLAAGVKPEALYAELIKTYRTTPAPAAARPGAPDPNAVYKVEVGDAPRHGAKEPKVTIIEFSDFQCPFCGRVEDTLAQVLKTYGDDVAIAWKNMPLPMHADAPLAAEASMAANAQGKFWEMHDKMFANQKALKREDLIKYAGEIGLDVAAFTTAIDTHSFKARVDADVAVATKFGVTGTPKFFINGRVLGGAVPFDQFKTMIDAEIKKADALLATGITRPQLYAKMIEKGLMSAAAAGPGDKPPARPTVDPKAIHKVVVGTSPVLGPADAPITIVEFSDFQCPFCSKVETDAITKIKEAYAGKVRFVWKNLPLPFHDKAHLAAEAAMEAYAQGKFWEMHDKLFANQKELDRPALEKYATELGLNMVAFKAALDSGKHKAAVDADAAYANTMGAQGTPAFMINGRFVSGARPFEMFKPVIDEEMARADALIAKGTPKAKLYDALTAGGAEKAVWITPPAGAPGAPGAPAIDTTVYNIEIGDAPFHGPKFAPVTIVEFSDFQCPFCSKLGPVVKELEAEYAGKIKVVFKNFPLSFHKNAPLAAEAGAIAAASGKFWEMHDILFANQTALERDNLIKYAGDIGLNVAKFTADLDSHKFKAKVDAETAEGTKYGVSGTPTSYINGRKVVGANKEQMKALIEAALKGPAEAAPKGPAVPAPAVKGAALPTKVPAAPAPAHK